MLKFEGNCRWCMFQPVCECHYTINNTINKLNDNKLINGTIYISCNKYKQDTSKSVPCYDEYMGPIFSNFIEPDSCMEECLFYRRCLNTLSEQRGKINALLETIKSHFPECSPHFSCPYIDKTELRKQKEQRSSL